MGIEFLVVNTVMVLVSEGFSYLLKNMFVLQIIVHKDQYKFVELLLLHCCQENHLFSLSEG